MAYGMNSYGKKRSRAAMGGLANLPLGQIADRVRRPAMGAGMETMDLPIAGPARGMGPARMIGGGMSDRMLRPGGIEQMPVAPAQPMGGGIADRVLRGGGSTYGNPTGRMRKPAAMPARNPRLAALAEMAAGEAPIMPDMVSTPMNPPSPEMVQSALAAMRRRRGM
jgi:hypothetical protein